MVSLRELSLAVEVKLEFNVGGFGDSPTINSDSNPATDSPAANKQPAEREIPYICGLGAKVECERLSERSNCRDESHKYRVFLFLWASLLPAAPQNLSKPVDV